MRVTRTQVIFLSLSLSACDCRNFPLVKCPQAGSKLLEPHPRRCCCRSRSTERKITNAGTDLGVRRSRGEARSRELAKTVTQRYINSNKSRNSEAIQLVKYYNAFFNWKRGKKTQSWGHFQSWKIANRSRNTHTDTHRSYWHMNMLKLWIITVNNRSTLADNENRKELETKRNEN